MVKQKGARAAWPITGKGCAARSERREPNVCAWEKSTVKTRPALQRPEMGKRKCQEEGWIKGKVYQKNKEPVKKGKGHPPKRAGVEARGSLKKKKGSRFLQKSKMV